MKKDASYSLKHQFFVFLKFIASLILCVLYCFSVMFFNRVINRDCFYSKSILSYIFTGISCIVLIVLTIFLNEKFIRKLFKNIRLLIVLVVVLLIVFISPFCFIKCGIITDSEGIKRNNILGKTVEFLPYKEITSIDVSVRNGIQYEISFSSGKTIDLCSFEFGNTFSSDEALLKFDKVISQYAEKKATQDLVFLEPWNTRRFFRSQEVFEYFDNFFSSYYENSTGDE